MDIKDLEHLAQTIGWPAIFGIGVLVAGAALWLMNHRISLQKEINENLKRELENQKKLVADLESGRASPSKAGGDGKLDDSNKRSAPRSAASAGAGSDQEIFAKIVLSLRDPSLPSIIPDGQIVGTSVTLERCAHIQTGWKSAEVAFDHRGTKFRMPEILKAQYEHYLNSSYKKGQVKAGISDERADDTVMLRKRPGFRGTDQAGIILNTQLSVYSFSKFFWEVALNDPARYQEALEQLFEKGEVTFPHNLCLHLVVMTKDEKILLCRRSNSLGAYGGKVSCSIEENLKPHEDLVGDGKRKTDRWIDRALSQELGVGSEHCSKRVVLSVFLEGSPKLNISLAALVELDINHTALSTIIKASVHADSGENVAHEFITLDEMISELIQPARRNYHPTSRYRMLMTLLHTYGEADLASRVLGRSKK